MRIFILLKSKGYYLGGKSMKKLLSIILVISMVCAFSSPVYAVGEDSSDSVAVEKSQESAVSKDIIEQIYKNHATNMVVPQNMERQDPLNTDAIYEELSRIYLEIEQAEEDYQAARSEETKEVLQGLIERKNLLENQLTSLGHIFLTQGETDAIFGVTDTVPLLDEPTKPDDTSNHRYTLSPTYSLTIDGKTVKFFYVTAIPLSTDSTMHESHNIDIMKDGSAKKFTGALLEVYVSKIVAAAVAAISIPVSWLPYEMLSFTPTEKVKSDYQIHASYTSTPRFVWAGYVDDFMYYLEGTFHSTSVSETHVITSVVNGKTITDRAINDYTEVTKHYSYAEIREFVTDQYTEGGGTVIEKNEFTYYFTDDEGNKSECASVMGPFTADYFYLN